MYTVNAKFNVDRSVKLTYQEWDQAYSYNPVDIDIYGVELGVAECLAECCMHLQFLFFSVLYFVVAAKCHAEVLLLVVIMPYSADSLLTVVTVIF